MDKNVTLVAPSDSPASATVTSSWLALAVTLPLVLVLLASVAAAAVYRLRCGARHIMQLDGVEKAEDSVQYTQSPRYETNVTTQPVWRQQQQEQQEQQQYPQEHPRQQQQPIYENVHRGSTEGVRDRRHDSADHETRGRRPHEELYLQCEPLDEAIYSNDPSFPANAAHFGAAAEDEYIVPDVL